MSRSYGVLKQVRLGEYSQDAILGMPDVNVNLSDGRFTCVNYLSVDIADDVNPWKALNLGSTIKFRTRIAGNDLLPGLQWVGTSGTPNCLMIGTKGGSEVVEILA